jgi:Cu-processing system permease protein
VSGAITIALHTLQESLRRRVLFIVAGLTIVFGGLYWLVADRAFAETANVDTRGVVDDQALVGGTLVGLAMFGAFFLGTVLGAFLTLSAVRGDAEQGILQPLVVRPVGRTTLLLARFAAAGTVCAIYVVAVFLGAVALTRNVGGWTPDRVVAPAICLAGAVLIVVALSILGSTFLTQTANGIAVFMLFGAGLVAGLIGQIGDAINSGTMQDVGRWSARLLPYEALYQGGLDGLTTDTRGLTGVIVQLGPFGGAQPLTIPTVGWAIAYGCGALALAAAVFARRDL